MLRAFWDAALELDPAAPDEGRTMRYCTPEELASLWRKVGLRAVETEPLVVEAAYDDFDDYWSPFPTGIAPSGAYCASLDDDARATLREACFRRLGSPSGAFTLMARAWFVIDSIEGSACVVRRSGATPLKLVVARGKLITQAGAVTG